MAQKYKVFFNQNVVYFGNYAKNETSYYQIFRNPDKKQLTDLSHQLLTNGKNYKIFIECTDISVLWKDFKQVFQIKKAAGGLVINGEQKILFIKRRGLWDLPKGHIEPGEKKRECALREVSEECGIHGQMVLKKLVTTYHTYYLNEKLTLKPSYWFLMQYMGIENTQPQIKEGITDAVWVSGDQIQDLLKESYPSISVVLEKFNDLGIAISTASF